MPPLKGQVWMVTLDPVQGHEQAKERPCVVLSNDQMNTKLGLSIVVPFTGRGWYTNLGKLSPVMIEVVPPEGGLTKTSYTMAHQVRTVSHERFTKQLGSLKSNTLESVVRSVQEIIEY